MKWLSRIFDFVLAPSGTFDAGSDIDDPFGHDRSQPEMLEINPVTGLPMISGIGSVDVAGSPYGIDLHSNDDVSCVHSLDAGSNDDSFMYGHCTASMDSSYGFESTSCSNDCGSHFD